MTNRNYENIPQEHVIKKDSSDTPNVHPARYTKEVILNELDRLDDDIIWYDQYTANECKKYEEVNEKIRYSTKKIKEILDSRLYYCKDYFIHGKIEKLLNGEKLSAEDRDYTGFEEYEKYDNYLLDLIIDRLKYKNKKFCKEIKEVLNIYNSDQFKEYDEYESYECEDYEQVNEEMHISDDKILNALRERFKHDDNRLHYKIQKVLDGKRLTHLDKDYTGYEEYEEIDNNILNMIQTRIEKKDYVIRRKINEIICRSKKDEEYEKYESLYHPIELFLEKRLSLEDHGIRSKIQKILNNEKLTPEDNNYTGYEEYEVLDNYILKMIKNGLPYDSHLHDDIQDMINYSFKETKKDDDKNKNINNVMARKCIDDMLKENDPNQQKHFLKRIENNYLPETDEDFKRFTDTCERFDEIYKDDLSRSLKDTSLLALLIYAEYDGVEDISEICQKCKDDKYYKYITDNTVPTESALQEVLDDYDDYIMEAGNCFYYHRSNENDYEFNNVYLKGMINRDNHGFIMKMNDVEELLNILPERLTMKKVKQLEEDMSLASYSILTSNNMTLDEKMKYVQFLKEQLIKSKKEVLLNSQDVNLMLKKGKENSVMFIFKREYDFYDSYDINPFTFATRNDFINPDSDDEYYGGYDDKYPSNIKETSSFIEYLKENPYDDDFIYDFETDTYTTNQGIIVPLKESISKESEKDYPERIMKTYNVNHEGSDIKVIRETRDYKNIMKIERCMIPEEVSARILNEIRLKVIAYNMERGLNAKNHVKEDKDNLKNFINQLKREYPDIKFKVKVED